MTREAASPRPATTAASRQKLVADRAQARRRRTYGVCKRLIDVILGSLLAVLSFPILLVLATLSAAAFRSWPFFVQSRPGRDGRPFRIVKIRTLPTLIPTYGHKTDFPGGFASVPTWSKRLRGTHLDELPQLFLVPLGRMSLVGPRPSQPLEYEHLQPTFEEMRTTVRPGCTGLWQIGAAHDLGLGADPEYDTLYLERASLRLDLWILVRTGMFMLGLAHPITLSDLPQWVRHTGVGVAAAESCGRTDALAVPSPAAPHSVSIDRSA